MRPSGQGFPVLQPYASESMSAYEVSRAVNAVTNDGPELIAPV